MFDEPNAAMTRGPIGQSTEAEFGPPTQSPRNGSETKLKHATRSLLCADMVDEHDLAARPDHPHEFIESGLRLGHRSNDELSHHDIE